MFELMSVCLSLCLSVHCYVLRYGYGIPAGKRVGGRVGGRKRKTLLLLLLLLTAATETYCKLPRNIGIHPPFKNRKKAVSLSLCLRIILKIDPCGPPQPCIDACSCVKYACCFVLSRCVAGGGRLERRKGVQSAYAFGQVSCCLKSSEGG